MPRNDQITRQWYLLRRLENSPGATLHELIDLVSKDFLLKDGRLKMTLKVADTIELVGWILSFGSQARVVRPDALREKVKEEARKILRL